MDKNNQTPSEIIKLIRRNFVILVLPILASIILSLSLSFDDLISQPTKSKKNNIIISLNKVEKDNFTNNINSLFFERDRNFASHLFSFLSYPSSQFETDLLKELKTEKMLLLDLSQSLYVENMEGAIFADIYRYLNKLKIKFDYDFELNKEVEEKEIYVNQNYSGSTNQLLEILTKKIETINEFYSTVYVFNFQNYISKEVSLQFKMIDLMNQLWKKELKHLKYTLSQFNEFFKNENNYNYSTTNEILLKKNIEIQELKIKIDLLELRIITTKNINSIDYFKNLNDNALKLVEEIIENSFKKIISIESLEREISIDHFSTYSKLLIKIILFSIAGAILSCLILLYLLSFSHKKT